MKNIIIIFLLLSSLTAFGQKLDSLQIYVPTPELKKVHTSKNWKTLGAQLDSLNNIYHKDLFVVMFYMDNRQVITKMYSKRVQKQIKI